MARTPEQVQAELRSLLPTGWLWDGAAQPGSNLDGLLTPPAAMAAQLESDAEELGTEINPGTSTNWLPLWEQLLDLPDPCAGPAPDVAARQAQALARYTDRGTVSIAGLTAYAQALGFNLTITEFREFKIGLGVIGQPMYDLDWACSWMVSGVVDLLSADGSVSSARQDTLLCEFRRIMPYDTWVFWGDPPTTANDFSPDLEDMVVG